VGVGVIVGVGVMVGVGVNVGVRVAVEVRVAVGTGVCVAVGIGEGVMVAVGDGSRTDTLSASFDIRPLQPDRMIEMITSRKMINLFKCIDKNGKIPLF